MTSKPANPHVSGPRRLRGTLVGALSLALSMAALAVSAQSVVHPTQAERTQHRAHAQQLKSQQQSREMHQRLQQQINKTASKAYKHQPEVQSQMSHASSTRQRQADARNREHKKKIERAQRPLPIHTEPAPTSSR